MSEAVPSRAALADAFRTQARGCEQTGSPLYAALLDRAADDVSRGGVFADAVATYRGLPILDALPLRLLGRAHALVLAGEAPALARFFPSAGGRFEIEGAWRALVDLMSANATLFREAATSWRVQTNEVRRSAALLPGFLRIAARTDLPLRLREIGASAGLNQHFDRYRYELGPHHWGNSASPLCLAAAWQGAAPDLAAPLCVAERCGCDVAPIDLRDPAERVKLQSFIWPEQYDRLERLRTAIELVAAARPRSNDRPLASGSSATAFLSLVSPLCFSTALSGGTSPKSSVIASPLPWKPPLRAAAAGALASPFAGRYARHLFSSLFDPETACVLIPCSRSMPPRRPS